MHLVCPQCGATNRVAEHRSAETPICGRCKAELAPAHPVALTDDQLAHYLAQSEPPVLVDFWADWCGPCKAMAPHFAHAAAELPAVRFAKVDTDESPRASGKHGIRGIPTLILFRGGTEVARRSGAVAAPELVRWVQEQLGS